MTKSGAPISPQKKVSNQYRYTHTKKTKYFPTLALSKSGYRSKVILSSQPVLQAPFFHLHLSYTPILKDSKDIRLYFRTGFSSLSQIPIPVMAQIIEKIGTTKINHAYGI